MKETLNKHRQKTEETRRKLIKAARRVFARDGFERSRLEDIAAEAGYTRGAFYAHFSNKEQLFIALLEQHAAERIVELAKLLERGRGPEEQRLAMREFYASRAKDKQWALLTLEFKLHALRYAESRAQLAAAHRRIRESLHVELITRYPTGMTRALETQAKVLLEVIWSGLVVEHAYDPKRITAEEVSSLLGRMFDLVTSQDFSAS